MNRFYSRSVVPFVLFFALLGGCGTDSSSNPAGPAVGFVLTTDFTVGNLSTITTTSPRELTVNVLGSTGIHPDSVIRVFGNRVFIVQRLGSNSILVIDPSDPSNPLKNYSTNDSNPNAPQSDPQDIAFVDFSKAYITRYNQNTLLIVNPLTGERIGTIDLSQFSDSDDIVEMHRMVIVNGKLYVSLQRLDRNSFFSASNDSYLVVIDTTTDAIIDVNPNSPGVQPIVLEGRNPLGGLVYLPLTDRIYLANTGNFFTGDAFGGIESIDPNTNTTAGIIISDESLGGSLGNFAVLSSTVAYATIFDDNFDNFVVPVNLSTLVVSSPLTDIGTEFLSGLSFDRDGFLYVADRNTSSPGIQVFDTTTNAKIEGPIDTGLPPNELAFVTP